MSACGQRAAKCATLCLVLAVAVYGARGAGEDAAAGAEDWIEEDWRDDDGEAVYEDDDVDFGEFVIEDDEGVKWVEDDYEDDDVEYEFVSEDLVDDDGFAVEASEGEAEGEKREEAVESVEVASTEESAEKGGEKVGGDGPLTSSASDTDASTTEAGDAVDSTVGSSDGMKPIDTEDSESADASGESAIGEEDVVAAESETISVADNNSKTRSGAEEKVVQSDAEEVVVEEMDPSDRAAEAKKRVEEVLGEMVEDAELAMADDRTSDLAFRLFRLAAVLGHSGAMATVSSLFLTGDIGVKRDLPSALRYLHLGTSHGQPDAHATLAFLHASGLADRYGVEKSEAKALLYWTFAAETGSIVAEISLGYRYLMGRGVEKSCQTAARYYVRAARAIATDPRFIPSLKNFLSARPPLPKGLTTEGRLRLTEENLAAAGGPHIAAAGGGGGGGDDAELLDFYRHSAAHGNLDSLTTLAGLQLFGGHGLVANENLARPALERAAGMGHGEANGMLAHMALKMNDNATALTYFKESAKANDKIGLYGMGMLYLHGVEVEENATKAVRYFIQAAELQHPDAAHQTGMAYWRGDGVKENTAEAYRYFQQGKRLGQTQAIVNLGFIVLEGRSPIGSPDCEAGVKLLKRVAEAGEWKTVLAFGSDEVDNGNMFSALYRYMQAAHAGLEVAQYNAALILEKSSLLTSRSPNDRPFKSRLSLSSLPGLPSSLPQLPSAVSDIVNELLIEFDDDSGGFNPRHPLHTCPELMHWSRSRLHEEALELYEMSFLQGHVPSVLRAGNLAYTHVGDYERAAGAYFSGSSVHCAECSFSLGMMHARGLGVAADRTRAIQFMKIAQDSLEGALPASLAISLMKFVWWATDWWSKNGANIVSDPNSNNDGVWGMMDIVIVAALSGILGLVIVARRKRLAGAENVEDGGEAEDVQAANG